MDRYNEERLSYCSDIVSWPLISLMYSGRVSTHKGRQNLLQTNSNNHGNNCSLLALVCLALHLTSSSLKRVSPHN